jgi:GNAT superfamily N-acetyltransferase
MEIRQFKLSESGALLAFLKKAYPDNPRQSDERFWRWHFLESPYVEPDNMPVWIAVEEGEIIGQLAAIPVRLQVGAEEKSAIWILDFIVDEKCRGRGVGKKLILALERFCPLGLGVNTNEQTAPLILQKMGWKIVRKIPRYNKLLFPGEALREVSQFKPLRALVNAGFAPLRPRPTGPHFPDDRVRPVEEFDSAFDDLWRESRGQWSCAVVRSAKLLDWQYRRQPGKRFECLGFYEKEKLLGYAVLFFRRRNSYGALPKAAITDILYHPEKPAEIIDALLRAAVGLAVRRRAGTLVTDTVDTLVQERLKKSGFINTKSLLQLMVKADAREDLLYDPASWFLARGDSDISIFEEPNLD